MGDEGEADRIERGFCPRCVYDLRGRDVDGTCPECGHGYRGAEVWSHPRPGTARVILLYGWPTGIAAILIALLAAMDGRRAATFGMIALPTVLVGLVANGVVVTRLLLTRHPRLTETGRLPPPEVRPRAIGPAVMPMFVVAVALPGLLFALVVLFLLWMLPP